MSAVRGRCSRSPGRHHPRHRHKQQFKRRVRGKCRHAPQHPDQHHKTAAVRRWHHEPTYPPITQPLPPTCEPRQRLRDHQRPPARNTTITTSATNSSSSDEGVQRRGGSAASQSRPSTSSLIDLTQVEPMNPRASPSHRVIGTPTYLRAAPAPARPPRLSGTVPPPRAPAQGARQTTQSSPQLRPPPLRLRLSWTWRLVVLGLVVGGRLRWW